MPRTKLTLMILDGKLILNSPNLPHSKRITNGKHSVLLQSGVKSACKLLSVMLILLISHSIANGYDITGDKVGNGKVETNKLLGDATVTFDAKDFKIFDQTNAYLYMGDNVHRLTRQQAIEATGIFYKNPIDIRGDFSLNFQVSWRWDGDYGPFEDIPERGSPADGITFMFHQNDVDDLIDIGSGGMIGQNIFPSTRIEFDVWHNSANQENDPICDHVEIMLTSARHADSNSPARLQNNLCKIENNVWYKGRIIGKMIENGGYLLQLYMIEENEHEKGYQLKKEKYFEKLTDFLGNGVNPIHNQRWYEVLWGFTSSTGANYAEQKVKIDSVAYLSTTVEISAIPETNENYRFVHWTDELGNVLPFKQKDTVVIYSDLTIIAVFENALGIAEDNSISNIHISPNPTNMNTTVKFNLEAAGNLTVTLNDLLGNELLEIYNDFVNKGIFSKTFSIKETFTKGTYFLKINHNGNSRVEKLIKK